MTGVEFTAKQPCGAPHHVISFNERCRLVSERVVNLAEDMGHELRSTNTIRQDVVHYSMATPYIRPILEFQGEASTVHYIPGSKFDRYFYQVNSMRFNLKIEILR